MEISSGKVSCSRQVIYWGLVLKWNQWLETRVTGDQDCMNARTQLLPKKEGGNLYGTVLYVQKSCTYVQLPKIQYVRTYVYRKMHHYLGDWSFIMISHTKLSFACLVVLP
jgi:hypothetical protein